MKAAALLNARRVIAAKRAELKEMQDSKRDSAIKDKLERIAGIRSRFDYRYRR